VIELGERQQQSAFAFVQPFEVVQQPLRLARRKHRVVAFLSQRTLLSIRQSL